METSVPGEPPFAPQRVSDTVSKGPTSPEAGGGTVRSKRDRLTLPAVLRCPPAPTAEPLVPFWALLGSVGPGLPGAAGAPPPPPTQWMLAMTSDPKQEVGICETKGQCA